LQKELQGILCGRELKVLLHQSHTKYFL
jgi:hypothetical protein